MSADTRSAAVRAFVLRGAGFYLAWVACAGTAFLDLLVGIPVAALAAHASLFLLQPGTFSPSLPALAGLALRFPVQSLHAGLDVATRAFRLPARVDPGHVTCSCALPPGPARSAFRALMSLQPGSLPVDEAVDGGLVVHSLDMAAPVAAQFAREEARFAAAIGARAP